MILTFLFRYPIFILGAVNFYYFPVQVFDSPLALIILLFASLLVLALILWADQYENEEKKYLGWAFLWGGLVATTASFLTYWSFDFISESILFAAIAEEFFKFLGLYIAFRKQFISWWTDGLVFGSMIGLGFTLFEDLDYIAFSENPLDTAIWRSLGSIFAHSFFTGVFGALFVVFLLKKDKFLTFFAFLFAGLSHYTWNYSTYYVESWWAYIILPPFSVIALGYFLRLSERDVIKSLFNSPSRTFEFQYPQGVYYDLALRKNFLKGITDKTLRKQTRHNISHEIHTALLEQRVRSSPR